MGNSHFSTIKTSESTLEFTLEAKQMMQDVFGVWQNRLQRLSHTYQLQIFKIHTQEGLEKLYNLLGAMKVRNIVVLANIENSELLTRISLRKTMGSVENKKEHLNDAVVKIITKQKISLLNNDIQKHHKKLNKLQAEKHLCQEVQKELLKLQQDLYQEFQMLQLQIEEKSNQLFNGLHPARIERFDKFTADESYVNKQCVICLENIELGMNMIRLDCEGRHSFCQKCITSWFAENNTCPVCRHVFQ